MSAPSGKTLERSLPPEARSEARFDAADSAGVFVGVRFFEDPALTEIKFAVDDAVDLAYLFTFHLALLVAQKVVLALEGEPQKESSQKALEWLLEAGATRIQARSTRIVRHVGEQAQKTGERGIFVFTFAGHGLSDQSEHLLVTHDLVRRRPVTTGLKVDDLMDDIRLSVAPRRLVLIDACRSGSEAVRSGEFGSEPMSPAFQAALLAKRGLTLLSGTTMGGFAYDDVERKNGVFTSAVIDVLLGKESSPASGALITIGDLAQAADQRVREWVKVNRPHHELKTLGISCVFDPESMRQMPLAKIPARWAELEAFRKRRRSALENLRNRLEKPLTGALFDQIEAELQVSQPGPRAQQLLEGMERLDGSEYSREALLALFERPDRETSKVSGPTRRRNTKAMIAVACGVLVLGAAIAWLSFTPIVQTSEGPFPVSEPKVEIEKGTGPAPPKGAGAVDDAATQETVVDAPPPRKAEETRASEPIAKESGASRPGVGLATPPPSHREDREPRVPETKPLPEPEDQSGAREELSTPEASRTETFVAEALDGETRTKRLSQLRGSAPSGYLTGQTIEGSASALVDFSATLAVHFSSELGVDIATVVWAAEGQPLQKKPVYQPGASLVFDSARGKVRLDILALDRSKKMAGWSAQLIPRKLDCRSKTDSLRQAAHFWTTPVGRYGVDQKGLHLELDAPFAIHKRCVDCRVKAVSYKISATLEGDPGAASYGLYLLDMSEVREEMYTFEIQEGGRQAAIRQYVRGAATATLWSGTPKLEGKIRLAVEAKDGKLSAWVGGQLVAEVDYDADSVPDIPLGSGFFVVAAEKVPVSAGFSDYQLETCVDRGE